jgi:hypothetical protein
MPKKIDPQIKALNAAAVAYGKTDEFKEKWKAAKKALKYHGAVNRMLEEMKKTNS